MMTDKQTQMMDHLSELGRATIQHHLVTEMTRRKAITSQPSVNKTTIITPFYLSFSQISKAIKLRRRLNTSQSDQVKTEREKEERLS